MCTKITEVNLFAFIYRLFHEDFSPILGTGESTVVCVATATPRSISVYQHIHVHTLITSFCQLSEIMWDNTDEIVKAVFLYCCPGCQRCPAYSIQIGRATWANWAAMANAVGVVVSLAPRRPGFNPQVRHTGSSDSCPKWRSHTCYNSQKVIVAWV